jgi:two-component system OmpR family response regulator
VIDGPARSRILIVDDDQGIRDMLADFLEAEGYDTLLASQVAQARRVLEDGCDLILLDLNMPGGDGLSFAAEIRSRSSTPIIIISGKGGTIDRVVGLEIGADDYLAKPFELRELLARIRAVLRRVRPGAAAVEAEAVAEDRQARFGGCLRYSPARRRLSTLAGEPIDLTGAETALLASFLERPNRVLSRDAIADLTQRGDTMSFDRAIDTLVSRLRRKLEPHVDSAKLIQTVRGEGYVLASTVEWTSPRK